MLQEHLQRIRLFHPNELATDVVLRSAPAVSSAIRSEVESNGGRSLHSPSSVIRPRHLQLGGQPNDDQNRVVLRAAVFSTEWPERLYSTGIMAAEAFGV